MGSVHLPENTILGELEILKVYEYYDGPKIFLAQNWEEQYLVYWCDYTQYGEGWLYAPIDAKTLVQLEENEIDLTEAFMNPSHDYVYYVGHSYHDLLGHFDYAIKIHVADVPNKFYPPHGHYIRDITLWDSLD